MLHIYIYIYIYIYDISNLRVKAVVSSWHEKIQIEGNCKIWNLPGGCGNPYWAQTGRKKSRQHPMFVYIHQNIDICCVVNQIMLAKTAMQFFTVPIPMECSRSESRNTIHLHVTMRDISGKCCYSMLNVLLSLDSTATVCSTFWYLRKLLLQHVLRSDISRNYYYSMFFVLISQEITGTVCSAFWYLRKLLLQHV